MKVEKRRGSLGSDYARGTSQASEGLSAAFGFVAVVMALWLGGRALDGWLDTEPWLQLVGAIAGWVLGTLSVIYSARYRKKS
jgi:F0F1-type ATP synthase assembly protein I